MRATYGNRMVAVVAGIAIAAAVPALAFRGGWPANPGAPVAGASQRAVGAAAQAAAVRYWTTSRMTRDLVRQPPQDTRQAWLSGDTDGAGLRWTHGGAVSAAVGRVFFTLGGAGYACSGALIDSADSGSADSGSADSGSADSGSADPDVVLTAAHCVTGAPGRGRAPQGGATRVFGAGFPGRRGALAGGPR